MSHLDPDRLAAIALGETATDAEHEHLAGCDRCAVELAELEYTVTVGRSTVSLGDLEAPPDRVWTRIADELSLSGSGAAAPAPLADSRAARSAARRRRRVQLGVALAASVALVLAAVVTWTWVRSEQTVQIASATLQAFPAHPTAAGRAQVLVEPNGRRVVDVQLDDGDANGGYREVWLMTADASSLISLGLLDGSSGQFAVPSDVDLRDYSSVDVSQEPDDGDPAHSGDSIVRGTLAFA